MRKLTNNEFLGKLKQKHGNDYTPLEEYKGATTKIKVKHEKCGRILSMSPDKLYSGGCIHCGYVKSANFTRKTQEQFENEVYELVGDEYTVIGKYVSTHSKILMRHNTCGYEYEVQPSDFLNNRRCPKHRHERIAKGVLKDQKYFINNIPEEMFDLFNIVGKYTNARTGVELECKNCNAVYKVRPDRIYKGITCSKCLGSSKGEQEVRKYLSRRSIDFIEQWNTEECRHISRLRFDFAVMENDEVKYLIEYNGKQHYEPVDFFGGQESFKLQLHRDKIKKEYCDKNNIPLFIIRYDENVEEVLDMLIPR